MKKVTKAQLKNIRELMFKKEARDKRKVFIAEGRKIVKDIFNKGYGMEFVLVRESFCKERENERLISAFFKKHIAVFEAEDSIFEKLSGMKHSQGILASVRQQAFNENGFIEDKSNLLILCDGVQDPGNLGSIIRTSAAFGASGILMTGESADIYNPKVVRASSGTILDIPIRETNITDLERLKKIGYTLIVSKVTGDKNEGISLLKKGKPAILAFGSEGRGVSDEIRNIADSFFYIPIRKEIESLNVSIAVGIALYEWLGRNPVV